MFKKIFSITGDIVSLITKQKAKARRYLEVLRSDSQMSYKYVNYFLLLNNTSLQVQKSCFTQIYNQRKEITCHSVSSIHKIQRFHLRYNRQYMHTLYRRQFILNKRCNVCNNSHGFFSDYFQRIKLLTLRIRSGASRYIILILFTLLSTITRHIPLFKSISRWLITINNYLYLIWHI